MKENRLNSVIALVAVLNAVRAGLILTRIMSPLSVNSSANTLFNIANIAILAYAGRMLSKQGFKDAAENGAIIALAGFMVTFAAVLIGRFLNVPVLGMNFPSQAYLMLGLLIMAIANVFLGAIAAVIGTWLGRKIKN